MTALRTRHPSPGFRHRSVSFPNIIPNGGHSLALPHKSNGGGLGQVGVAHITQCDCSVYAVSRKSTCVVERGSVPHLG